MKKTHHEIKVSDSLGALAACNPCFAVHVRENFYIGTRLFWFNHTIYGVTKKDAISKGKAFATTLKKGL